MKTLAKILLLLAFLIPNVVLADEPIKFYSHQSGGWDDPNTWTTDPSGISYINPGDKIPTANDEVYIIPGVTVYVPEKGKDNKDFYIKCKYLLLNGVLSMNGLDGQHQVLETIEGNGRILLHIDNFPANGNNKFMIDGGTTVFQDATVSLTAGRIYSNLEINNSTVTFAGNVDIQGSLSVVNYGNLIFNSETEATVKVRDNLNVNNSCNVSVVNTSAPFKLSIGGDLNNDGTIKFTTRTTYSNDIDTKGYVDVYFNSTTHNQTVNCNSVITFYSFHMEKGERDDYALKFTAYSKDNFHILGPANGEQNNIILNGGILEIGSNILIPFLHEKKFTIPANSTLLVDAGTVNSDQSETAIFVEGKLKVDYSGRLFALHPEEGITLKKSGIFEVNSGSVKVSQIQNGSESTDYGSYYQTGGNVVVDNNFSLSHINSGFLIKGGVLTINNGGILINSSSANYTVEGGSVVMKSANGFLASNAPFPSLTLESDDAMIVVPSNDYPLKVNGNLTIGNTCTLNYDGIDVYVGGNFNVKGSYTCNNNTTHFNGNGNTEIKVSDNNDLSFSNLTIAKSISDAKVSTNKDFSVKQNLKITGGELVNAEHDIYVNEDISIENGGINSTSGFIKLAQNQHPHTLTSPLHNPCCFGNLSYSGENNLILAGPVIAKDFIFESVSHLVELNGHYVEVTGDLSGDDSEHYFLNNGKVSGGLRLHFTLKKGEDKTINYHIGDYIKDDSGEMLCHYTPSKIVVSGNKLTHDYTGSLLVNAVGQSHPNLLDGANIGRYWVVDQRGFDEVPNDAVEYLFTNYEAISSSLVVKALIPFKGWKASDISIIEGSKSFSFKNTNYGMVSTDITCALDNCFNIKMYRTYSGTKPNKNSDNPMYRMDGKAHDNRENWRLLDANGAETTTKGVPGAHDIAYIYYNRVHVSEGANWEVGQLVLVDTEGLYATKDDLEHQPRLQVFKKAHVTIHRLSGEGVLVQNINSSENTVTIGDMSVFAKEPHSWIMYILFDNVNNVEGYPEMPNLALEENYDFSFGNIDKVINFDFNMRGKVRYIFPEVEGGNLFVGRDLYVGDWKGAEVKFNKNGASHTMTVKGDVILSNNGNPASYNDGDRNITINGDPSSAALLEHRLIVSGNILLGSKKLQLSKSKNNKTTGIILELDGNKDAKLVHYDPSNPNSNGILEFWKIVMNKEQGKTFTINRDFELKSANNTNSADAIKPITMKSGHLILNNKNEAKEYILSSGEKDFVINPEAELETFGKAKYTILNGMQLSGTLQLDSGSVWTVGKSIEYTESATCRLRIGDATMNVGSQIRPPVAAGGSISLELDTISSVLNVGTNASITNNGRGLLELVNKSVFKMHSGSKLHIKNHITDSNVPDININPEICEIDPKATIYVDGGKSDPTTIVSKVEIPRLEVKDNSKLKMMSGDLTISGLLHIESGSEFATSGYKLFLKGGMNSDGTFTHNSNTTYICGLSTQYIYGDIHFYNLVKNTDNNVLFNGAITIDNKADFLKGSFIGNKITALGNVTNNAAYLCPDDADVDNGFRFGGDKLQILKSDGNGKFDKIILDNPQGVQLPTGNSFTVDKKFQLNQGNFDLGTCTITMDKNAIFTTSGFYGGYSVNNMIKVTDAYATGGVRKIISGPIENFEIPIGTTDKYTPVHIKVDEIKPDEIKPDESNIEKSLTVRPVNEMTNCATDAGMLSYYWIVKSENIKEFSGSLKFQFSNSETSLPQNLYGVLHQESSDKFISFEEWNFNNRELTFTFPTGNDEMLTGKYLGSPTLVSGGVPEYYAKGSDNPLSPASWETEAIWYTNPECTISANNLPTNAVVHIASGYVSMANVNSIKQCKMYIEENATLDQALSQHNYFGTVLGKGTLKSASGDLPSGVYDDFNSANGGTLWFYGAGRLGDGYSILKQMPQVNNLVIESDKKKNEPKDFPNMDVHILGNLTIDGSVQNSNNSKIFLKGDLDYKGGKFTTGNLGTSEFIFDGTDWQNVTGVDFTADNCIFNLVVDNPKGIHFYNDVFVHNTIEFNQGVINPCGDKGVLTLDNSDPESVIRKDNDSYVDGPFRKRINNGENYTFPVGNINPSNHKSRYGALTIQNTETEGSVYWTVQYIYDTPFMREDFSEDILGISANEYWKIYAASDNYKAQVLTRWDDISSILDKKKLAVGDIRQVRFNPVSKKWEISGSEVTEIAAGKDGYVTSKDAINISKYSNDYSEDVTTCADFFTFGFQTEWNYSWCGSEDGNRDWYNNDNWVMGFFPTNKAYVKIGGNPPSWPSISNNTAEGEAHCRKLTLCEGAVLDVESKGKLTVTEDIIVDPTAKLTLRAATTDNRSEHSIDPTGSLIYNGTFTGELTFERLVRKNTYERMCVPVTGYNTNNPNLFRFLKSSYERFHYYKESENFDGDDNNYTYGDKFNSHTQNPQILVAGWDRTRQALLPDDSDVRNAFRFIYAPMIYGPTRVLEFKGKPVDVKNDVVIPVTFTENDHVNEPGFASGMLDGWNLSANPFVSAVDASKLGFDNVDQVVYLHDNVADQSMAYIANADLGVGLTDYGVNGFTDCQYIPAGQSFFVHSKLGGGTVKFPSNARSHGDANTKVKSGSNGGNSEFEKIIFNTTSNGMRYQSVVYFADDATEEVDSKYDAYLQESSTANALFFYSFGGDSKVPLAANALPGSVKDGGEIRLGYSTVTAGTYTLSLPTLKLNNAKVYLVDTENNTTTELAEGFATKIDVAKGTNNSRFKLVFELLPEPEPEPEPIITEPEVVEPVVVTPEPVVVEPVVIDDPEKPEVPSGPVTITITRPTEDPINNNENSEVSTSEVVTPNPDNLVTVEDPVMPIYVDPESPVTVEPYFPEVVDIEPVLPEVITDPVQAEIPSDINPVLPEIIPEITPDPIQIPEPIVDDNAEMPLPDPVQFVDNDDVFVTPFGDGDIEVDEDIKIYPVPSDGRVTVDFGSLIHETGSVQMTLITGSGRILTRKTVYDDSVYLDLTGRTGIYLIRLVTPSKTITKRIIIQ